VVWSQTNATTNARKLLVNFTTAYIVQHIFFCSHESGFYNLLFPLETLYPRDSSICPVYTYTEKPPEAI